MKKLLLILFVSNTANAQILCNGWQQSPGGTPLRLYLSATTGGTAISPTQDAGWEIFSGFDRRSMSATKDGSTIASKVSGATGIAAAGNRDVLIAQFIGPSMGAGTLSGSITAQIRGNTSAAPKGKMTLIIRVIASNGTTVRGIAYSSLGAGVGTDYTATLTNRSLTSVALTPIATTSGDYPVAEFGWTYTTGSGNTNGTQSFGSSSGTDLPVDNTTTSVNTPWIEFSNGLP